VVVNLYSANRIVFDRVLCTAYNFPRVNYVTAVDEEYTVGEYQQLVSITIGGVGSWNIA
jgi:hypothetical protein